MAPKGLSSSPPPWLPLFLLGAWLGLSMMWWGLAFWHLPSAAPEWLVRTRQVCFGSAPNGLPAPYGWLDLVAGPAALLGGLIAIWGRELTKGLARLGRRWAGRLLLTVMVAAPLAGGVGVVMRVQAGLALEEAFEPVLPQGGEYPAASRLLGHLSPRFQLVDQNGEVVTQAHLKGQGVLLTFAYGHCETVCPVVVRSALDAASRSPGVRVWIITLDPWRDTTASLPTLARHWGLRPQDKLLSGPVDEVNRVLAGFEMHPARDPRNGEILHPALVIVAAPDGRLTAARLNPPPQWLAEQTQKKNK